MSGARIGGLFEGYGGLTMATKAVYGGDLAWVSDVCKFDKNGIAGHYEPHRGPCRVLAHRYPDVPNLGDITKVDWSEVEPVDILTGGSPCQDISGAGKRAGMTEGTRSNLWVSMREAIAYLRPSLVIWENVGGAYSAAADSDLEQREGRLGDRPGRPALRALGRVLGDLASLGYDASWHGLPASDVGASHGRLRVFVAATNADVSGHLTVRRLHPIGRDAHRRRSEDGPGSTGEPASLLPTPAAYDADRGGPQHPDKRRAGGHSVSLQDAVHGLTLLPTPAVNDMGAAYTPDTWDQWTAKMKAAHDNGNGHGKSLNVEVQRLLPTPSVADSTGGHERRGGARGDELLLKGIATQQRFGEYAEAVRRQEIAFGRPAPDPTEIGPKGNPRLSCRFDEWLMGLPDGWITDVPGIAHNEVLKLCGNGVVWQQAAEALRVMASWEVAA